MATLKATVHVHTDGETVVYLPGVEVLPEHVKFITNPDAWEGEAPAVEVEGKEPPRGGPGSSAEAWAAYALSIGIDSPEGANKSEIIAIVDAAKE